MATATIKRIWIENGVVNAAVVVVETGSRNIEYIGSIALDAELNDFGFPDKTFADLTNAEKRTALTQAVKAQRDRLVTAQQNVGGITGTIEI